MKILFSLSSMINKLSILIRVIRLYLRMLPFYDFFVSQDLSHYPLIRKLGRNDLVIDCGANIGDVSSAYLKTGCQVIAFEPNPHCVNFMKRRFGKKRNLIIEQKALTDHKGISKLYFHELGNGITWSSG